MTHQNRQRSLKTALYTILKYSLLLTGLLSTNWLHAEPVYTKVIEVTLGDYRYTPGNIKLTIDQPVVLRLVNVDSFTPHNFTLEDASDGLDVNVDIPAGKSVDVYLMPLVASSHTFYCKNKLWLMDSHREKGMEGTLTVVPELQLGQQAE
ncbi:MAG: hypothetical protein BMS9Abin19_0054 [Gammaproteobacteria bacterium]|nr:MAG: hypothetical protein BMS9Abin19_0054 [Gammaproteobacteria bacterium]